MDEINNINFMGQLAQIPVIIEQFNKLTEFTARLEHAISAISIDLYSSKLVNKVLFDILIENNLITEEELNKQLDEKVNKNIEQYIANLQKAHEKVLQPQEEAPEVVTPVVEEEPEEEVNDNSNVILASERFQQSKDDKES